MTKKNTAEVANKIRADLVREKILKEALLNYGEKG